MLCEALRLPRGRALFIGAASSLFILLLSASASAGETFSQTVQVSAVITPQLELSLQPEIPELPAVEAPAFGIIARPAGAAGASQAVDMIVTVASNLGQAYQVTQRYLPHRHSAGGRSLPPGGLRVGSQPMGEGAMPIFRSDENGTSETLNLPYRLLEPSSRASAAGTLQMTVTAQ